MSGAVAGAGVRVDDGACETGRSATDRGMPTETSVLGGLLFGAIGMGALLFGKAVGSVLKMVLGAVLVACAYLIEQGWLLWTSGTLLTVLLWRWKE